jgi:hypothetical protein
MAPLIDGLQLDLWLSRDQHGAVIDSHPTNTVCTHLKEFIIIFIDCGVDSVLVKMEHRVKIEKHKAEMNVCLRD